MIEARQADAENTRTSYHHGNLRRGLLNTARQEIARHGVRDVSLASLARLAGVSQPAPYRHFADRNALLEAVATEAFQVFPALLSDAKGSSSPADWLAALALNYVAFGEQNVEIYRLMFASGLVPRATNGGPLDRAAAEAFAVLESAVAATGSPGDLRQTYAIWAQLHGLVMLKVDGFIASPLCKSIDLPSLMTLLSRRADVSPN